MSIIIGSALTVVFQEDQDQLVVMGSHCGSLTSLPLEFAVFELDGFPDGRDSP